jgi:hypothetical protein
MPFTELSNRSGLKLQCCVTLLFAEYNSMLGPLHIPHSILCSHFYFCSVKPQCSHINRIKCLKVYIAPIYSSSLYTLYRGFPNTREDIRNIAFFLKIIRLFFHLNLSDCIIINDNTRFRKYSRVWKITVYYWAQKFGNVIYAQRNNSRVFTHCCSITSKTARSRKIVKKCFAPMKIWRNNIQVCAET